MNPDDWLPTPASNPAAIRRLVVLPHAGSGAAAWFRWQACLPSNVELRVARLPGRENRFGETPLTSAPRVITALVAALRELPPRPLVLFGHSLGALLGYGICCALGGAPRALVVSGQVAPGSLPSFGHLSALPDIELAEEAHARWGAIPAALLSRPEALSLFLPALRSDLAVAETFSTAPGPPLDIPLYILAGTSDPLDESGIRSWLGCTRGGAQIIRHPGGHMAVLLDQAVTEVAIGICLRELR